MVVPEGLPRLRRPVAVAAFEGWNDAAEAASDAVDHLVTVWSATSVAELDPDEYYDFTVARPTVSLVNGQTRRLTWPTSRIMVASPPGADHDVVLVRGIEPNMRWRNFCAEIIAVLTELGVQTVASLGALLSDTPHTRPVAVSGTAYDDASAARFGLERSRYEGPTGIVGVLHGSCVSAGLPAVSFWAAVPHYLSSQSCPKATLALLRRVEDLLDVPLPMGDLAEQAQAWQRGADEFVAENAELTEYVRDLESRESEEELPEASGDAIAREFERYLRRRDTDR